MADPSPTTSLSRQKVTRLPPQVGDAGALHPSLRKGAQVWWQGKVAKIANEPTAKIINGTIHYFDLLLDCEGGEVHAVTQKALLTHQETCGANVPTPHRAPSNALSKDPGWLTTKKELTAWRQFEKDADAVEATALGKPQKGVEQGEHAHAERSVLKRLRSEGCAEQVATAWSGIAKYRKGTDDDCGRRVIKRLLDAFTYSAGASTIRAGYEESEKHIERLVDLVDKLNEHFTIGIARDPEWKIVAGGHVGGDRDSRSEIASLAQLKMSLRRELNECKRVYSQTGLTRKTHTPEARRVMFTVAMSNAMCDIFGRPLDHIVCILANAVFKLRDTLDIDQIKQARIRAQHRRDKAWGAHP
jgi:hypothetical protein